MKVIDLLNKIANGEEVPKKIKYKNRTLYLEDEAEEYEPTFNYYDKEGEHALFEGWIGQYLNDEVEIIEENNKITKAWVNLWEAIEEPMLKVAKLVEDNKELKLQLGNIVEKKDKKIEKLSILTFSDLIDMPKEELVNIIKEQRFKINEIIDEVNKLKDDRK